MSDPIRIPLSPFLQSRFASIALEIEKARSALRVEEARQNEAATALVGQEHDPVQLTAEGWTVRIAPAEIVLSPPASSLVPKLVSDVGPDGVSASAAAG